MNTLVDALKHSSIGGKPFSPIGDSSYLGTRTYLQLDLKNEGWSVVRLNLIQRMFRAFFGCHKGTRLQHALVSVKCEALRRSYSKEEQQTVRDLEAFLYKKWWSHHDHPHIDWRMMYYPKYAKIWNAAFETEQKAPKTTSLGWVFSLFISGEKQQPFPSPCR